MKHAMANKESRVPILWRCPLGDAGRMRKLTTFGVRFLVLLSVESNHQAFNLNKGEYYE